MDLSELRALVYDVLEGALIKLECQSGLTTAISSQGGVIHVVIEERSFELRVENTGA
ncbi:MAG: hypothetical protein AB7L09_01020 [Nitrospira sp.]